MQEDNSERAGTAIETDDAVTTEPSQPPTEDHTNEQTGRSEGDNWRGRAERAENKVNDLADQLATSESSLEQARHTIDAVELRRSIEHDLAEAEAIDLETATILTEAALESMDEPDVMVAIQELRRRKPFLFRSQSHGPSAMSAVGRSGVGGLDDIAESARRSGDRRELLRYLRMKRGG